MGLLDQGIDVSNIDESGGGVSEPMPAGEYTLAAAVYSEETSKAGNPYLKVEYNVVGPSYEGRKIWENFTLTHAVGLGRLKSFINATGGDATQTVNTDMMRGAMGKQFTANVAIEEGNNGYAAKNKISSFKGGSASAPATAQPQAPQQAQATPAPGLNTTNVDWGG